MNIMADIYQAFHKMYQTSHEYHTKTIARSSVQLSPHYRVSPTLGDLLPHVPSHELGLTVHSRLNQSRAGRGKANQYTTAATIKYRPFSLHNLTSYSTFHTPYCFLFNTYTST